MIFWNKKQANKPNRKRVIILSLLLIVSVLIFIAAWWKEGKITKLVPIPNYQISKNTDITQQGASNDRAEQALQGTLHNPLYDPDVTITSEGNKHYRNEEYGFEFDFPKDWTLRQPAFGNTQTVLFNLDIINQPRILPNPILITILREDWVNGVMDREEKQGNIENVTINGVEWKRNISPSDGLPHIHYLFNLGEYWIDVGGKTQYEDILNGIIETVKFTK